MSLKINNNVTATNALRNLDMTNTNMSGSITRLSTGLRIVNAADDPAGMVISEGMRAQLKGLRQADSNTQNAINMAKTAEGAMSEVQTLLSDMRALAVQAANSAVVDAAQLQADQNEISSSVSSIDRIARDHSVGGRKNCSTARRACAAASATPTMSPPPISAPPSMVLPSRTAH